MCKEKETKEKARQEAEAKCESMARQNRYIGVFDKFIHEGHEALSSFAKTKTLELWKFQTKVCLYRRGAHFCLERLTDFHKLEIVLLQLLFL